MEFHGTSIRQKEVLKIYTVLLGVVEKKLEDFKKNYIMSDLNLTKENYDYFRKEGFEVVKSQNGKYYIRPYPPENIDHKAFLEAKAKAIQCGFAFDSQGDILAFNRKQ